jgi:hypothetical protein
MDIDKTIERTLDKAPKMKDGETGLVGADLCNGYVLRIEYHTSGKTNICDDYRTVTSERWDWERAGVDNAADYRKYLNRQFWNGL